MNHLYLDEDLDEPSDEDLAEIEAAFMAEDGALTGLECARLLALLPRAEAEVREHERDRQRRFIQAVDGLDRRVSLDMERYCGR